MTADYLRAVPDDQHAQDAIADLCGRGWRACDAVRWYAALRPLSHFAAWCAVITALGLDPDEAREWLARHGMWHGVSDNE